MKLSPFSVWLTLFCALGFSLMSWGKALEKPSRQKSQADNWSQAVKALKDCQPVKAAHYGKKLKGPRAALYELAWRQTIVETLPLSEKGRIWPESIEVWSDETVQLRKCERKITRLDELPRPLLDTAFFNKQAEYPMRTTLWKSAFRKYASLNRQQSIPETTPAQDSEWCELKALEMLQNESAVKASEFSKRCQEVPSELINWAYVYVGDELIDKGRYQRAGDLYLKLWTGRLTENVSLDVRLASALSLRPHHTGAFVRLFRKIEPQISRKSNQFLSHRLCSVLKLSPSSALAALKKEYQTAINAFRVIEPCINSYSQKKDIERVFALIFSAKKKLKSKDRLTLQFSRSFHLARVGAPESITPLLKISKKYPAKARREFWRTLADPRVPIQIHDQWLKKARTSKLWRDSFYKTYLTKRKTQEERDIFQDLSPLFFDISKNFPRLDVQVSPQVDFVELVLNEK